MDTNKSGTLSGQELAAGLRRYGIEVAQPDIDTLMAVFDANGDGCLTLGELMRGLRGPLPLRRWTLIRQAFSTLDRTGAGVAKLDEIAKIYDAAKHPLVIAKKRTAHDILRGFLALWDRDADGNVTWEEFLDYYKDVSALIDKDDYFELMMRNVWHISGGEGVCANTSNIRVLVSFVDGNQVVREVQGDLGVKRTDLARIKALLEAQGLRDIVKVDIGGAV